VANPAMYDNVQRDGFATITKLARLICVANNTFGWILRNKFRAAPPVLLLLDTLDAVCAALPAAASYINTGGNNADPISDPTTIPGVDVGAPPWVDVAPDP
jgi:hypothetical protein